MRIELEDICVTYPGHVALDRVSVTLASGTCTALLGPSGAGKSSLLGVIDGLVVPSAGRVRFEGEDVTHLAPEQRGLGVVFQDLRLFDFMTARDNVAFAPRVAGVRDVTARVDEALSRCKAEAFADRPARVLSGGERQRIALARALAMRPRALLLDEPFAALDRSLRAELREELRTITRDLTTVLVTHDRDDAFALASHVVALRDGRVEQAGAPAALYARPASAFVATLLGEAAIVPIRDREATSARVLGTRIDVIGEGANAIVRPEALELANEGWAADVIDVRFEGARYRVTLAVSDVTLIVSTESAPTGRVYVRAKAPLPTV